MNAHCGSETGRHWADGREQADPRVLPSDICYPPSRRRPEPSLPSHDMDDLALARTAALAAAGIIVGWRDRIDGADYKGTVDPVTVADREAEAAIAALIAEHRPADGLLAERVQPPPPPRVGGGSSIRWTAPSTFSMAFRR